MKRNNTEKLGDVIMQLLRQEGLETPLNQYRLIDSWKDIVGPADGTRNINKKPELPRRSPGHY